MRIMIVGAWGWHQYEDAFSRGLRENDIEVIKFSTSDYFKGMIGAIQQRLPIVGPAQRLLNLVLVEKIRELRPQWVLFWRPTHIVPSTLHELSSMSVNTISYNNDDPFGPTIHGNVPWHHHWLWFWYLKCLPLFNRNYFYRKVNCTEAKAFGAVHAEVLLPYFLPWQDRPVALDANEKVRFESDVVFVGHYEPDGREQYIRALVLAGFSVKIWGGSCWNRTVLGNLFDILAPIVPAEGDNYAKALSGAKVCLCFLSRLNRDTYTRRCFEIPACGRVMLAERTDDLLLLFKENEEACFFSSNEEMLQKVHWLIANPDIRDRIALAGMRRVWADGHDVKSRARLFIDSLYKT